MSAPTHVISAFQTITRPLFAAFRSAMPVPHAPPDLLFRWVALLSPAARAWRISFSLSASRPFSRACLPTLPFWMFQATVRQERQQHCELQSHSYYLVRVYIHSGVHCRASACPSAICSSHRLLLTLEPNHAALRSMPTNRIPAITPRSCFCSAHTVAFRCHLM